MNNKICSFAIPCYNSAGYMDTCIQSILTGSNYADDIEIIIVDDGSTKDETPAKADEWQDRYPNLIKAVHQENAGHGGAVLKGLENATGTFFKVVDSDDWLDADALAKLLDLLRASEEADEHIDLFITNHVYEHTVDNTETIVRYRRILPEGRIFGWHEIGHFNSSKNLLMHALCYRTKVLTNEGVPMPKHTFYVDNIYAWVPLPRCRNLRYADLDLYRYYIGREDQSVNEQVMAGRIDQQLKVTRIMMNAYHLYEDIKIAELRSYMVDYFVIMMVICSTFTKLSDHEDAPAELEKLWKDLHDYDRRLWRRCRLGVSGQLMNLPGPVGNKISLGIYHLAHKVVKFN